MRVILVIHRYLGVVVGLVMTLWCLSGFVMMYQGYPRLTAGERQAGLESLRLQGCCDQALTGITAADRFSDFGIEMLAGRSVLRLAPEAGEPRMYDLTSGRPIAWVMSSDALAAGRAYGAGHAVAGRPRLLGLIAKDQWTVEGARGRGPVYRMGFDDPAGSEIYVAARTGKVVQDTTRAERVWSWFGAIPHWLYPVVLRQNGQLWSDVVVWTSLIGCFLTVTGLYVGIARFKRYKSGRWSPFRGWFYWHHIAGLIFGVLTLTWVASGLFTMNPWGFLDSPVGLVERGRLSGAVTGADVARFLTAARTLNLNNIVEFDAAPLGRRLFVMAVGRDGGAVRLDVDGAPRPLGQAEMAQAARNIGAAPVASLARLDREDAYYYSGYDFKAVFPVYRARLADAQDSTFYMDAASGRMVQAVDRTARESRWLRTGLHDFDFAWMRRRPVWDLIVLLLLAGVTGVCITGSWLGLQRLWRDLSGLKKSSAPRLV